jgi:hypothetical protein
MGVRGYSHVHRLQRHGESATTWGHANQGELRRWPLAVYDMQGHGEGSEEIHHRSAPGAARAVGVSYLEGLGWRTRRSATVPRSYLLYRMNALRLLSGGGVSSAIARRARSASISMVSPWFDVAGSQPAGNPRVTVVQRGMKASTQMRLDAQVPGRKILDDLARFRIGTARGGPRLAVFGSVWGASRRGSDELGVDVPRCCRRRSDRSRGLTSLADVRGRGAEGGQEHVRW